MASGPIPPPLTVSSFQATRAKVGPFFAIAGVAAAAWFMKQGYEGNKDIWEQNAANHHTQAEYDYLREGWGHDSGHPFFDHLEHKLKGWGFFGPNGILTHYHEAHAKGTGFRNDVIYANLFPITLAVASIYLGFGSKKIHGWIGNMFRSIKPNKTPKLDNTFPPFPTDTVNFQSSTSTFGERGASAASRVGSGTAKAAGKGIGGLTWLFRGGRAPFTLIALGFGAFAFHTFRRVWNHSAQEDRFRGFIHGAEH